MNPSFAFDTSALVSLGHTELVELLIQNYNVIISNGILKELKTIRKIDDKDGEAATKWLKYIKEIKIRKVELEKSGEDELFDICLRENIPMVTDDIKATKKFGNNIEWIFSVHLIFLLYYKKIISKERAIFSIEKMITERSWKNNIISITGKMLFE